MTFIGKQEKLTMATITASICPDKLFFVQSNIEIIQGKNFVQDQKVHFLISKAIQNEYKLSRLFQSGNFILTFIRKKMDFLTLDKIFVLDNLYFVLDKNSLVGADA